MKYSLDGQNETKLPQRFPLLPQHTVWGSVPMLPQILKSHLTMYTVFTFHVLMWPKWTITQNNCARNCNTHMVSCPTQLRWFTPASYEQLLNFCSPSLQVPFNQTYYNMSLPSQTSWTFALLPPTQTHTIYRSADFIIILSSHRYTALTFPPNGNTWPSLGQISTDRHHETISSVTPLHSVFLSFLWHLDFISPRCSSLPPARTSLSCNITYSSFRRPISSLPSLFVKRHLAFINPSFPVGTFLTHPSCLSPFPQIYSKCLTKLFRTVLFSAVCEPPSSDMYAWHDALALFNYRDAE